MHCNRIPLATALKTSLNLLLCGEPCAHLIVGRRGQNMDSTETFLKLVESICRHRGMYVCGHSFYEVCAYFTGYAHASPDSPLSGDGWEAFGRFICAAFRFPSNYAWPYVVRQCSRDDDEAIEQLRTLLTEFATRARTEAHADIVQDMISRASEQEEGEPERTWRRLAHALLTGRRDEIEPLIQAHPEAEILWSGAYPDNVALALDELAESQPVTRIPGSEQEGVATIITPDFGPVSLKLVDGSWRVDASKVIACWKASRRQEAQRGADSKGSP